jgi:hypothetical protein
MSEVGIGMGIILLLFFLTLAQVMLGVVCYTPPFEPLTGLQRARREFTGILVIFGAAVTGTMLLLALVTWRLQ